MTPQKNPLTSYKITLTGACLSVPLMQIYHHYNRFLQLSKCQYTTPLLLGDGASSRKTSDPRVTGSTPELLGNWHCAESDTLGCALCCQSAQENFKYIYETRHFHTVIIVSVIYYPEGFLVRDFCAGVFYTFTQTSHGELFIYRKHIAGSTTFWIWAKISIKNLDLFAEVVSNEKITKILII